MTVSPMTDSPISVLRRNGDHRVTYVELFFDLVFVFAVTQLSHHLLAHLSLAGVLETAILMGAVWWLWMYTAWATNWLDPQTTQVRIMLFALMLAGLVLSMSIPQAFGARALAFAGAYALMQIGRCLFMLWALRGHSPGNFRNFQRILVWNVGASALWLAGALAEGEARILLWIAALLVDCIAPAAGYWTPVLGRSTTTDWDISGGHMAERCGLFIIIALGESILVTGATFGDMPWAAATAAAFVAAFIGTVAMWWIYYNVGAERGSEAISRAQDPGRLGRLSYTYIHLLLVAGIIVAAVADELVLAHPLGHAERTTAVAVLGGPALFLVGNILFKRTLIGSRALSHCVGLGALALLALAATVVPPLALAAAATLALVIVAVWETRSFQMPRVPAADRAL